MQLLSGILGQFVGIGVLALLIVFQPEIRRFLLILGKSRLFSKGEMWKSIITGKWNLAGKGSSHFIALYKSIKKMSESKTGALIVLCDSSKLTFITETGLLLNANISSDLIESIFFKNSPLHDGAVLVHDNKIIAAKCILPITENTELPSSAGLRHKSAVGITEQTDAIAIVVSEETGQVSYAKNGALHANISFEELGQMLKGSS